MENKDLIIEKEVENKAENETQKLLASERIRKYISDKHKEYRVIFDNGKF